MIEKIVSLDKELFVFLNGLGSESFDGMWVIITQQIYWIPFFAYLLYLAQKKMGTKQILYILLFVSLIVLFTDQFTNFVKHHFYRLRPCNDLEIKDVIRIVLHRNSFSFFSGHASNSMAVATFLFLILRKHYKYFGLIFFWPLIFAYSRIYLGLHFPVDILTGYAVGAIVGYVFFKIYQTTKKRYFPIQILDEKEPNL